MSKMVACKACEKEIAKGVKKCPNCGKDQRNWFMRHKIMTFLGVVILLVIFASVAGGGGDETADSNGDKEEVIYEIGDVIEEKQLEVTVIKMEEFEEIGDPEFFGKVASDGATLVAIQYTMKNISDEPVGMFSYPSIKLVDEDGTEYSTDVDTSSSYATETKIDNSKVLSDLNPDISVTGVDAYEVSKSKFEEGNWYIKVGNSKVQIK